jgi:hypothetical protein
MGQGSISADEESSPAYEESVQSDLHRHWPSETPAFDITFQASSSSLAIAVRLALPVIQNSAGLGMPPSRRKLSTGA